MSISELEKALQKAIERQAKAVKALAPKHKGGEEEEFSAARSAVLQAERALAAAKGEPYAVVIDFPVAWDTGAPLPFLLRSDYQTFLIFLLRQTDTGWDGSYVTIRDPSSAEKQKLALVEFKRCICTKMGTPNDEVFHGHSLYGKGFEGYCPLKVENSKWIKELEAINAVHPGYQPKAWFGFKHYIFPFHDSMFECVAESFEVEMHDTTFRQLMIEACQRLT